MKEYFIFTDKPLKFVLYEDKNEVCVELQENKTWCNLEKFVKELKQFVNRMEKKGYSLHNLPNLKEDDLVKNSNCNPCHERCPHRPEGM
jgi:hypothetical protein